MNVLRVLLVGSCGLLAACGDDRPLQDASERYRLVAKFDGADVRGDALRDVLQEHGARTLLFTHAERLAEDLADMETWGPAWDGISRDFRLVTIGPRRPDEMFAVDAGPERRRFAQQTAVVVEETGAAVAVDLALLFCHGIAPPHRLALGTHMLLPDGTNVTQPAPGDFAVALTRREHAELLTDKPQTDVVFRIGCVTWQPDGRHLRVRNQAIAAAKRYPQVEFVDRSADGDPQRFETIVRELLADGHRAILISTDDPKSLAPLVAAARERNVALFVLDPAADCEHATCCIGCDQQTLGRAAGEAVKRLAADGAAIVELATDLQDESVQLRHRAFCDLLGLKQQ